MISRLQAMVTMMVMVGSLSLVTSDITAPVLENCSARANTTWLLQLDTDTRVKVQNRALNKPSPKFHNHEIEIEMLTLRS